MEDQPLSAMLRELMTGLYELAQSEIRLAKAEMRRKVSDVFRQSWALAVFALITWLGLQSLIASAIIGLGVLFRNRYWLSALLVGLALALPGIVLLNRFLARARAGAWKGTSANNRIPTHPVEILAEIGGTRRAS